LLTYLYNLQADYLSHVPLELLENKLFFEMVIKPNGQKVLEDLFVLCSVSHQEMLFTLKVLNSNVNLKHFMNKDLFLLLLRHSIFIVSDVASDSLLLFLNLLFFS
jgi:hypothetical protein